MIWHLPLGVGCLDGWGNPTHMCMCMHTHMYRDTHTHTHTHVKHDTHGCLHGSIHLQFLNMLFFHECMCMVVWACTCMCVHVGYPIPIHTHSCGAPNHWDNSVLFKDLWSLDTPALIQTRFGVQEGVSLHKQHFCYFWAWKVHIIHSCQAPGKTFPFFTLDPLSPCLDWTLIWFLTS